MKIKVTISKEMCFMFFFIVKLRLGSGNQALSGSLRLSQALSGSLRLTQTLSDSNSVTVTVTQSLG